jgi:hypothetical protein
MMTGDTLAARPVSYATRDQARAYVTSLTRTQSTAPAYLIASPAARDSHCWPRWTAELAALLPGLELITWQDLPDSFTGITAGQRPARLASALRAAIVLPDKDQGRRWIGRTAAAEARAFLEAGKPVLVYAEGRLTAWPDCCLARRRAGAPNFTPLEVLIPAASPRPLPTLDASLRILGHAPTAPGRLGALRRHLPLTQADHLVRDRRAVRLVRAIDLIPLEDMAAVPPGALPHHVAG